MKSEDKEKVTKPKQEESFIYLAASRSPREALQLEMSPFRLGMLFMGIGKRVEDITEADIEGIIKNQLRSYNVEDSTEKRKQLADIIEKDLERYRTKRTIETRETIIEKRAEQIIQRLKGAHDLSAAEIAIRHIYMVRARKEEYLNGSQVGRKYMHLANKSNIEKSFNDFENNRKKPTKTQLINVLNSLSSYEEIQKAIYNDIDKLS